MAERSYKFTNADGEIRTVRSSQTLTLDQVEHLVTILALSHSPASHAPDRWGEVVLFQRRGRQSIHLAGLTCEETRQFAMTFEDLLRWCLVDDDGLSMGGTVPTNDNAQLDDEPDPHTGSIDFGWMDARRAV